MPDGLDDRAVEVVPEQGADGRRAVMGRPPLVRQQRLRQQRPEHTARELGQQVDGRVDRVDPPDQRRPQSHGRVEMAAADDAEHHDQAEQEKRVDETYDGEVTAELSLASGRHEQNDDGADEEHQEEGADQLCEICRKSSFLHWVTPPLSLDPKWVLRAAV